MGYVYKHDLRRNTGGVGEAWRDRKGERGRETGDRRQAGEMGETGAKTGWGKERGSEAVML